MICRTLLVCALRSYEQFYNIWKSRVDVKRTLESWGFPNIIKSKRMAALHAAVTTEYARRVAEFKEVRLCLYTGWCLRFGPIEKKYYGFWDISVRKKDWRGKPGL